MLAKVAELAVARLQPAQRAESAEAPVLPGGPELTRRCPQQGSRRHRGPGGRARLDAEAADRGVSRSALIREILTEHTAAHREELVTRRIVAGYRRTPPARPDAWGDLREVADHATADLLQRLDGRAGMTQ
jgi:hypothetical protein